jgi:hypothetical protein
MTSLSTFYEQISDRFRRSRNRQLVAGLRNLYIGLKRPLKILDVGGAESFWNTMDKLSYLDITIINLPQALDLPFWFDGSRPDIHREEGTALDLSGWLHTQFDVVISNSVIEHVGDWSAVRVAAQQLQSVAPNGWIQTPAFSFPIEPHFALPFIHWFGAPIRAELLRVLPHYGHWDLSDIDKARAVVAGNNLLTSHELSWLFPDAVILRERFLGLTKSFVVTWGIFSGGSAKPERKESLSAKSDEANRRHSTEQGYPGDSHANAPSPRSPAEVDRNGRNESSACGA